MNRHNDPSDSSAVAEELFTVNLTEKQLSNFWNKIQHIGAIDEECWDWMAGKSQGYGVTYVVKTPHLAHRMAYFLANGPFTKRRLVCHKCDNPSCCNPSHLFLGAHVDNSQDMVQKDRSTRGRRNAQAKLTEAEVLEIRERYQIEAISMRALAAEYGICSAHVSNLVTKQRWRHLISE